MLLPEASQHQKRNTSLLVHVLGYVVSFHKTLSM